MTTQPASKCRQSVLPLLALAAACSAFGQSYLAAPSSPIGEIGGAESVVAADVNNDGKLDLVYGSTTVTQLRVFLGAGDGNFTALAGGPIAAGIQPWHLVAADFNGDGHLDIAATSEETRHFQVFLGAGTGAFTPQALTATAELPRGIAAGDFNRDGRVDLAVTAPATGAVAIFANSGSGTFTLLSTAAAATGAEGIVARDLNKDNILDLAVANNASSSLTVLLGNGIGGFTSAAGSPIVVSLQPTSVDAGDFNRDGNMDLAVGAFSGGNVTVLLGNGTGAFSAAPGSPFGTTDSVKATRVADMNNDRNPDIVVFRANTVNNTSIFFGNGSGGFGSPVHIGSGGAAFGGTLGDVNFDGRLDFMTANPATGTGNVFLNSAVGLFWVPRSLEFFGVSGQASVLSQGSNVFSTGGSTPSITTSAPWLTATLGCSGYCVQVNTTGLTTFQETQTLIASLPNGHNGLLPVKLNLAVPASTLNAASGSPFAAAGNAGNPIVAGDFNRDGRTDIATIHSGGLHVLLGQANGSLVTAPGSPLGPGLVISDLNTADTNRDGIPDLVATRTSGVLVYLGKGDGSFSVGNAAGIAVTGSPTQSAIADLNGDGYPDVVSTSTTQGASVLLGNGSGSFSVRTGGAGLPPAAAAIPASRVFLGDLDSDGRIDMLTSNDGGQLGTFLGNGTGGFQGVYENVSGESVRYVHLRDLNRDGRPDVLFSTASGKIGTMIGAGDGTFAAPVYTPFSGSSSVVQAPFQTGDFDGDGRLDVAVTNPANSTASLVILLGKGDGTFDGARNFGVGTSAGSLAAGDFNLDGRNDLAVRDLISGEVRVLLGANEAATTTTLTVTPSTTVLIGTNLRLTATVSSTSSAYASLGAPQGTVEFYDGVTKIGAGVLSGGVATLDISSLAFGLHTNVNAVYTGGAPFAGSASGPVAVNITAPVWAVTKTHTGNFAQGQAGASYTVTVTNTGNAEATTGTLTEIVPAGLTLVSMSGQHFSCAGATCNLIAALGPSASTTVTVTVDVSMVAPPTVTNQVTMSGGGATATATASDVTTIVPIAGGVPAPAGINPAVSTGVAGTYTFTFTNSTGGANITVANVLINNYLDGRNACYLAYSVADNVLYLVPDSGGGLLPGLVLNGTGSTGNSQCQISGAGSSAVTDGATLTLTLNITFNTLNFAGNKVIYMAARNATANSGWQTRGARGIPPLPTAAPAPVSVSPFSGSGTQQTFSLSYRDATAASNLQTMWVLINTAIDGRGACYVAYYRPGNQIFLYPDNGDGTQALSTVLTGTNSISNSQCTVSAQGSSVVFAGSQMSVILNITFKSAFTGPKGIWMAAQTLGGAATSPWEILGAWVAP